MYFFIRFLVNNSNILLPPIQYIINYRVYNIDTPFYVSYSHSYLVYAYHSLIPILETRFSTITVLTIIHSYNIIIILY